VLAPLLQRIKYRFSRKNKPQLRVPKREQPVVLEDVAAQQVAVVVE
jgi:hypothetical protein